MTNTEVQGSPPVESFHYIFDLGDVFFGYHVRLVQQDDIGKLNLVG